MTTITIDGTEYDTSKLSDEAKAQLASIQFVDSELRRLGAQIAVLKTARGVYSEAMRSVLGEADEGEKSEDPIQKLGETVEFE